MTQPDFLPAYEATPTASGDLPYSVRVQLGICFPDASHEGEEPDLSIYVYDPLQVSRRSNHSAAAYVMHVAMSDEAAGLRHFFRYVDIDNQAEVLGTAEAATSEIWPGGPRATKVLWPYSHARAGRNTERPQSRILQSMLLMNDAVYKTTDGPINSPCFDPDSPDFSVNGLRKIWEAFHAGGYADAVTIPNDQAGRIMSGHQLYRMKPVDVR